VWCRCEQTFDAVEKKKSLKKKSHNFTQLSPCPHHVRCRQIPNMFAARSALCVHARPPQQPPRSPPGRVHRGDPGPIASPVETIFCFHLDFPSLLPRTSWSSPTLAFTPTLNPPAPNSRVAPMGARGMATLQESESSLHGPSLGPSPLLTYTQLVRGGGREGEIR